MRARFTAVVLVSAVGWAGLAAAQAPAPTVNLAGILGSKALLIVNGQPPRALAPGESHQGVRLVSLGSSDAVVDVGGARATLRMGDAPARVGGRGPADSGRRLVLTGDSRGHFHPQGSINGKPTQFLVDTGASFVAIGKPEADRMGLDYTKGTPVRMNTANGVAPGWRMKLAAVRVGDVELYNIDAVITPQEMPYVLLGNNVLEQFQMTRTGDRMVLERR